MSDNQTSTQAPVSPIVIIKTSDTTYDVSLSVDRLTVLDSISASLIVWLLKRDSSETITFDFHSSSTARYDGFASIIHLANAVNMCKAKTITTVNRIFDDVAAYLLFTTDELEFTPFGMIQFLPPQVSNPLSSEAVALQFAYTLLDRARDRNQLTDIDVEFIRAGKTVIKTA